MVKEGFALIAGAFLEHPLVPYVPSRHYLGRCVDLFSFGYDKKRRPPMSHELRHHHSRKKRLIGKIKIYGGITIACFLIMGGLFSFRGFLEDRTRGAMVSQAERYLGRKLTEQDAAKIEKRFGIKINTSGGDTSVAVAPGRENVFKERKLSEMVDRYASGKVDPADIEKAKRALQEQR